MDLLSRVLPQSILDQGLLIFPEEFAETAWPISLSKKVLLHVHQAQLAILGGDIYVKSVDKFAFAYDTWSVDINRGEKWSEYVSRSYVVAKEYLGENGFTDEHWFVLVVKEKPSAEELAISYAR